MANPQTANRFRTPRVAELVADELRQRIVRGDFNEMLPREAALLEEFGVSRPSLREAFRILETEGLIEVRRGKVGGAIVRRPTAETVAFHLGLVMQSEDVRLSDLAAARLLVEPECARLAAEREDHAEIAAQLEAAIAESEQHVGESSVDFTASAQEFHKEIVNLCGNVTMRLVVGVLEAIWAIQEGRWAEQATEAGRYPTAEQQRQVIAAHHRINRHIERGDSSAAARAMRSHLEQSQAMVDGIDSPVEVVPSTRQVSR